MSLKIWSDWNLSTIVVYFKGYAHERSKTIFREPIIMGFAETVRKFLETVMNNHKKEGVDMCEQGCSGMIFFIFGKQLFLANMGDSSVVLGFL